MTTPFPRYAAYTTAVGGPWATVNEVRKLENLPAIHGGDAVTDASPTELALLLQKIYLAVGPVITQQEARDAVVVDREQDVGLARLQRFRDIFNNAKEWNP